MRDGGVHFKVFRKEHTLREILYYLFDFDSPPLYLQVRKWWIIFKGVWIALNVIATLLSCVVLVLVSMPEFYTPDVDKGTFNPDFFGIAELLCVLFFVVDYVIRFLLTPKKKIWFVLDPHNIIDALTTIPYFIQLIIAAFSISIGGFSVLFLFRTFRLIKLARYHAGLHQVLMTIQQTWDLLLLFFVAQIFMMVITATAFFYAESIRYDGDRDVWVRQCSKLALTACTNGEEVMPYQSVVETLYWSVTTITTVGYRTEAPVSPFGKFIAALSAIAGVLFFAAPSTVLATNYKILRRQAYEAESFRHIDVRAKQAMKAQESLRRELQLANRHRQAQGPVRIRTKRLLRPVAYFTFDGIRRPIYEVAEGNYYVYPPLVMPRRDAEGAIAWTDDFNPTTAQRIMTLLLVLDSDVARDAAREALVNAGLIEEEATDNEVLIAADPYTKIDIAHHYAQSYSDLKMVVELDLLDNPQGHANDMIPVRFIISMPHMYPAVQVIGLLRETRVSVMMQTRILMDELDVPLPIDIVMASRLVRELSEISFRRKTDGCMIAYIHPSDAAALLEGFTNQFIPTPSEDYLVMNPYIVDQQVMIAMQTSFPSVKLNMVGAEAANSFFMGQHLSVDLSEEYMMEINITALKNFDDLGFGSRFRLQVPVCKVERHDVQFQLV